MKIIKPGVVPQKENWVYTGICANCGCHIEAHKGELDLYPLPRISCPTEGCFTKITMLIKM